jgi:hypothetical protein
MASSHGPFRGSMRWSSCAAHWVPLAGCNQRRFPQIFPVFEQITASTWTFWPMSAAQDLELLDSPAEVTAGFSFVTRSSVSAGCR